jgi:DNA/RNA-binding domain of Phe-tRNA-synthetase-like protein
MITVAICDELKRKCPETTLGCIQAQVTVTAECDILWQEIGDYCDLLQKGIRLEELTALPRIKNGQEAYKKLGKDPARYRLSSEALLRRVLQGKGMYRVNNIVDINNLISLKSRYSVGSYDVGDLQAPVVLTVAGAGEEYKGIGKEMINIGNLPVLSDALGRFGSPTSDSQRAMITAGTREILMCIYSFGGRDEVADCLCYASGLLQKYAAGKEIEAGIID